MNTKHILISLVTGALLTGSLAMAAPGNDQSRAKSRARVAKPTTTTTTRVSGNTGAMRTRERFVSRRDSTRIGTRNRVVTSTGNNGGVRTGSRIVTRTYPSRTYSYRTYSYGGYPYYSSYGYGYPYSGLGVSFGAPYYGYYPYSYGYPSDYNGSYPYNYSYGYYSYTQPAFGNGSIVVTVQSRLARAGYYHGRIDGVVGPGTSYAIRAYERNHGLRADGVISGPLLRNMGLRY
jgi:hypothetical protein